MLYNPGRPTATFMLLTKHGYQEFDYSQSLKAGRAAWCLASITSHIVTEHRPQILQSIACLFILFLYLKPSKSLYRDLYALLAVWFSQPWYTHSNSQQWYLDQLNRPRIEDTVYSRLIPLCLPCKSRLWLTPVKQTQLVLGSWRVSCFKLSSIIMVMKVISLVCTFLNLIGKY